MTSHLAVRLVTHAVMVPSALCLGLFGCASKANRQDTDPLGLDPQDSPATLYVEMAEEYYNRGQTEVAFRRAQQAIEADRKNPKAHVWLAFMYEEMGKPDLAATHYERAVKLAPNNSDVLYAFGAYQCRQRHYAEADVYFKKALENPLYATPWVAMTNAATCASSAGDAAKAERYYRAAVGANPGFGPALVKLAEIELKRGNMQGAKLYLDRFFEPTTLRTPATAREALAAAVTTERALGNRARAAEYEKALRASFPDTPETREL
ncbi:type IV pilus biogenesis/stability protein PilW [Thiocapsa bogorovii]|uniref:type IV pilus biogenesis/stability protein PilW n=1 Tax=Thiocapsa bogorovii TaxID=521689 RepID=UPI001E2FD80E|nr:type IV pilus biogenesis/stability protein PilW [Thiocapsa bogorovii]UHD14846.1 type IV pilus biogenesis/stability protein PilW [Thiocapsa bogorovii]